MTRDDGSTFFLLTLAIVIDTPASTAVIAATTAIIVASYG